MFTKFTVIHISYVLIQKMITYCQNYCVIISMECLICCEKRSSWHVCTLCAKSYCVACKLSLDKCPFCRVFFKPNKDSNDDDELPTISPRLIRSNALID